MLSVQTEAALESAQIPNADFWIIRLLLIFLLLLDGFGPQQESHFEMLLTGRGKGAMASTTIIFLFQIKQFDSRRGSRFLVRGAQWSFDLRGALSPKFAQNRSSLKIASKLHDIEKNIFRGKGGRAPLAPWIR